MPAANARILRRFGDEEAAPDKARDATAKAEAACARLAADPDFLTRIEDNPALALAELDFTATNVRTFRIHDGVYTGSSCSCTCFSISCGSGVGCNIVDAPGDSTGTHDE